MGKKKEPGIKPVKIKFGKFFTRAKAERLLTAGADPQTTFVNEKGNTMRQYLDHPNYHVRRKCWTLMGKPLPEDAAECAKFLLSIKVKETVQAPASSEVGEVAS